MQINTIFRFIFMVAITQIVACSTTPVKLSDARVVPAARSFAFQDASISTSSITVTRDAGHTGSACYLSFTINGTHAARFDVAETAKFYIPSGEILLRVGWDLQGKGLCEFLKNDWTQRESILKVNENKQFRLSIDPNGKLDVQRTDM
jgi:hypothetical protein